MNAIPYISGTNVKVTIPLIANGDLVQALSASYRLLDGNEMVLVEKTALTEFSEGDAEAIVLVAGSLNTVASTLQRDIRTIELYVTDEAGEFKIETSYVIEKEVVLIDGINSFQEYGKSLLLMLEMSKIDGFSEASKSQRINALIEARNNIGFVKLRCGSVTSLKPNEYQELPEDLKRALRRAQVYEADSILTDNESDDHIDNGISSITVGDAKNVYKTAKPLKTVIDKRALRELGKWIESGVAIGRK